MTGLDSDMTGLDRDMSGLVHDLTGLESPEQINSTRDNRYLQRTLDYNRYDELILYDAHSNNYAQLKIKVKSSMAKSLPVENLLPQNVCSIINYWQ